MILLVHLASAQHQVLWPSPPEKGKIILDRVITGPGEYSSRTGLWQRIKNLFQQQPEYSFVQPMGIDVSNEFLAVADPGAGGVHLLNLKTRDYEFLTGENKTFLDIIDVAIGNKQVFVPDQLTHTIRVFNLMGKYLRSIGLDDSITRITGIAYHDPYLYMVDTPNHRIVGVNEEGKIVISFGSRGRTVGKFNFPTFITVSPEGDIYISDTMNFRIQKISADGKSTQSIGYSGMEYGQFNRPKGVALDKYHNLYVVDNSFDNIQVFTAKGDYAMHFGSSGQEVGLLRMPTDIVIDDGLIYVTDTMNNRIQVYRRLNE